MSPKSSTASDSASATATGGNTKGATKAAAANSGKTGDAATNGAMINGDTTKPNSPSFKKPPAPSKQQRAIDDFAELEAVFKKVFKNKEVYPEIDSVLAQKDAEIAALTEKVSGLGDEVSRLALELSDKEKCREVGIMDHEKRTLKWQGEKRELEEQVKTVKEKAKSEVDRRLAAQQVKHEQEVAVLQRRVSASEGRTALLESQLKNSEKLVEKLRGEKAFADQKLKVWEDVLAGLEDVDMRKFEADFQDQLSTYLDVVKKHFNAELPSDAFDDQNWEHLPKTASFHSTTPLPLVFPPTNSAAARAGRHLAALTVLSEILTTMILTRSHLPPSSINGGRVLNDLLNTQYNLDPASEQMTRALLVFTYDPRQVSKQAEEVAHRAAREAASRLGGLLGGSLSGRDKAFRDAINPVFLNIARLWTLAQRSRKPIQASIFDATDTWEWEEMEDFGGQVQEQKSERFVMLNTVPRVWWNDDEDPGIPAQVLCKGCMVYHDQEAVLAVESEYRDWKAECARRAAAASQVGAGHGREVPPRSRPSGRARRSSTIDGRSVISYSSTSPTSPSPQTGSFLGSVDPALPGRLLREAGGDSGGRGGG